MNLFVSFFYRLSPDADSVGIERRLVSITQEETMSANVQGLSVVPVQINGMSGYQVQAFYRVSRDDLFERVAHAAVFQDRARAERFLERSKPYPKDWKHWGKPAGYTHSTVDAIQRSVAVYTVL